MGNKKYSHCANERVDIRPVFDKPLFINYTNKIEWINRDIKQMSEPAESSILVSVWNEFKSLNVTYAAWHATMKKLLKDRSPNRTSEANNKLKTYQQPCTIENISFLKQFKLIDKHISVG